MSQESNLFCWANENSDGNSLEDWVELFWKKGSSRHFFWLMWAHWRKTSLLTMTNQMFIPVVSFEREANKKEGEKEAMQQGSEWHRLTFDDFWKKSRDLQMKNNGPKKKWNLVLEFEKKSSYCVGNKWSEKLWAILFTQIKSLRFKAPFNEPGFNLMVGWSLIHGTDIMSSFFLLKNQ